MDIKMLQPVKVLSSHDLVQSVQDILRTEHKKRPFIVMDGFLTENPQVKELLAVLPEYELFTKIIPDPPASLIIEGAEALTAYAADVIVAIGGGSCLDAAKGMELYAKNQGQLADYFDPETELKKGVLLVSIPTTAGTGSELSNALVVTDEVTAQKKAILTQASMSDYAVLVPELTVSLPKRQTIASGLDAFSHAAEGYLSRLATPMTDAICEKIMFLLVNYLPRAVADGTDLKARERVLSAASLAGWMLNNAGTNLGHSTAHILGAKYHLVHGEAVAYALPGVLGLVNETMPTKVKEIGKILGADLAPDDTPATVLQKTRAAYCHFRDELVGLHPFDDYQLTQTELLTNVDAILHERFAQNTPVELTPEKVTRFLREFG
ncbi:iron-containing alcohol dehydrogenase [Ligilactobacillus animalis]|jgi:alcohol dehydrogenase|uniref:iron-containing alcohol dehydrogenase n=1 Tax=Ligilactobacillus animalis TaxID=1605 RepID=UPI002599BB80|nr:iron-containing alcohol dehydrogenase [Ligilactobacillus animalis]